MSHIFRLIPIFDWVILNSAKVSVLIIFLLLLKYLFRNKLGAVLNYLLWTVVIVGLILPWMPKSSISIYNLFEPSIQSTAIINTNNTSEIPQNTSVFSNFNDIGNHNLFPKADDLQTQSRIPLHSFAISPLIHRYLFLIWIFGIVILIITTIAVNKRFSRSIKVQNVDNWYLQVGFESVKDRLNIKKEVPVILTCSVVTPSLFGLLKPRLLLPVSIVSDFNSKQINHVFVHELFHLKHKDILVNWLVQGLSILHWFNPIIWYAFKRFREDQEIACDARTIKYFGTNNSKDYGNTLLKLMENHIRAPRITNIARLSGSKSLIKRRIINIRNIRTRSLALSVFIVAIVIIISFGTLANANGIESQRLDISTLVNNPTENQTVDPFSNVNEIPYNLPSSIRSIIINDNSPAGIYWSPNNQNIVLSQVSSWLKDSKTYLNAIPATEGVDDFVSHNIGPSVLHITGSDGFQTLIYPAWYTQINGQEVDAQSIGKYIQYIQDVVVLIEAKTNKRYFLESGPLYTWLKNEGWKSEFIKNSTLDPLYQTNENGLTYGSNLGVIIGNPQPDLISASGVDGVNGYVKKTDLFGDQPKNPEEAVAYMKRLEIEKASGHKYLPLYSSDGKTIIGKFKVW